MQVHCNSKTASVLRRAAYMLCRSRDSAGADVNPFSIELQAATRGPLNKHNTYFNVLLGGSQRGLLKNTPDSSLKL